MKVRCPHCGSDDDDDIDEVPAWIWGPNAFVCVRCMLAFFIRATEEKA